MIIVLVTSNNDANNHNHMRLDVTGWGDLQWSPKTHPHMVGAHLALKRGHKGVFDDSCRILPAYGLSFCLLSSSFRLWSSPPSPDLD